MELKDQLTSLETSRRLKELGVKQESLYFHAERKTGGWNVQDWHWVITDSLYEGDYEQYRNPISALTVAELGELLPCSALGAYLNIFKGTDESEHDEKKTVWRVGYGLEVRIIADTEAEARGNMLIYLLENGFLKLY